ncbi:MAG: hypothetical protein AMXMBFR13_45110 [Phycisphaerae bacterium]
MYKKAWFSLLIAVFCLPLLMGQGCFPPPADDNDDDDNGNNNNNQQPTTLLTATFANAGPNLAFTGITFNPTSANRQITVTVSGNATGSRPAVQVLDNQNNQVAIQTFPTTQTTTVTFNSTTTGPHQLNAAEFGQPSSLYTVTVTQAP